MKCSYGSNKALIFGSPVETTEETSGVQDFVICTACLCKKTHLALRIHYIARSSVLFPTLRPKHAPLNATFNAMIWVWWWLSTLRWTYSQNTTLKMLYGRDLGVQNLMLTKPTLLAIHGKLTWTITSANNHCCSFLSFSKMNTRGAESHSLNLAFDRIMFFT